MKKNSIIKVLAIILVALVVNPINVKAKENIKCSEEYIFASERIPERITEYLDNNIEEYVRAFNYGRYNFCYSEAISVYETKSPTYVSLVYEDEVPVGLFTMLINDEGEIISSYTKGNVIDLKFLRNYNSGEKIKLKLTYDQILKSHFIEWTLANEANNVNNVISSETEFREKISVNDIKTSLRSSYPGSHTISDNQNIVERQGGEPWCAAYVTAWIFRSLTNNSYWTASRVMADMYPHETIAQRKSHAFTRNDVFNFSRKHGYYPSYQYGALGMSEIQSQISSNDPIYMGASGHAYVVRGYHGSTYISIWNPYNASYETVQYGSRMVLSGVESTWEHSIYDFK